jgi:hypothetical protein
MGYIALREMKKATRFGEQLRELYANGGRVQDVGAGTRR